MPWGSTNPRYTPTGRHPKQLRGRGRRHARRGSNRVQVNPSLARIKATVTIQRYQRGRVSRITLQHNEETPNIIHDIKSVSRDDMLESTSESQGHGKAFEIEIQKKCYMISEEDICASGHCDRYDIIRAHNHINDRNISIKTSCSSSIDCSDIMLFLNSEDLDIVVVLYKQVGDIKEAYKTCVIDFDTFISHFREDVPRYCDMDYDTWFHKLQEYIEFVKRIPKGRCEDKSYKYIKKPLCKVPYFNIAPKVDSKSQRRVQCSINIEKMKDMGIIEFPGGKLYDKEYIKQIRSPKRIRHHT